MTKAKYDPAPGGNSSAILRSFIERVERMNEEKKAITEDTREIFAEAKGNGFDPKIMRIIIRRRAMDASDRLAQDALVDTYSHALGMVPEPDEGDETTSSSD